MEAGADLLVRDVNAQLLRQSPYLKPDDQQLARQYLKALEELKGASRQLSGLGLPGERWGLLLPSIGRSSSDFRKLGERAMKLIVYGVS